MGGLSHLAERGGAWAGWCPIQSPPRCTKCNSPPINGQCINHHIAVCLNVANDYVVSYTDCMAQMDGLNYYYGSVKLEQSIQTRISDTISQIWILVVWIKLIDKTNYGCIYCGTPTVTCMHSVECAISNDLEWLNKRANNMERCGLSVTAEFLVSNKYDAEFLHCIHNFTRNVTEPNMLPLDADLLVHDQSTTYKKMFKKC